jgi:hypothetical protein
MATKSKLKKIEPPARAQQNKMIAWGKEKAGFSVVGIVKEYKEFTNKFGNPTRSLQLDSEGESIGVFVPANLKELINEIPKKKLIGATIEIIYNGKTDNVHGFDLYSDVTI